MPDAILVPVTVEILAGGPRGPAGPGVAGATAPLQLVSNTLSIIPGSIAGDTLRWSGTAWERTALGWADITGKPSTFAPSAHTHPLSELEQSGATSGQVATWNGTSWAPSTVDVSAIPVTALRSIDGTPEQVSVASGYGVTANTMFGVLCSFGATGIANTAVGALALQSLTSGVENVALGSGAGNSLTDGYENTALGTYALLYNVSGVHNVAVGDKALNGVSGQSHSDNVGIGFRTLYVIGTGAAGNTAVGTTALTSLTSGQYNTAVGILAGNATTTGSGNVFIGRQAGYNETGSNKLYIHNNDSTSPLIGGDFSARTLAFNGLPTVAREDAGTNTVIEGIVLQRTTTSTAAAGLGVRLRWNLENGAGTNVEAARTDVVWTDAANGTEDVDFVWYARANGSLVEVMRVNKAGGANGALTIADRSLILGGGALRYGYNFGATWEMASPIAFNSSTAHVMLGPSNQVTFGNFVQSPDSGLARGGAAGVIRLTNGSTGGGAMQFTEMTAPSAPGADNVRIYAEDNGAGKTRLMALFPTGAAQQIAIEP